MDETPSMTVSSFILQQLGLWGVKRIYGVIGDANLQLLDALAKQNQIQYIACRHECSAALMASAEAKLTGRAGVCLATSGPGLANMINGLGDASKDGAGVFVLSGQIETPKMGTDAKQDVDQQQLVLPLAFESRLLAAPDALGHLMKKLWVQARYHGKVTHLSVPKNFYPLPVTDSPSPDPSYYRQSYIVPEGVLETAAQKMSEAAKPVIIAGLGAKKAPKELAMLAQTLGAPVVTSLPAKSVFPNDHELYAGGLGHGGSEVSSRLLEESDLIVILGSTWWPKDFVPRRSRILQIDQNPDQIGKDHPVEWGIVGDLQDVLGRLLAVLPKDAKPRSQWLKRIRELKMAWLEQLSKEEDESQVPVLPQVIMKILGELMDGDAVVTLDTGDHTLWFNRTFRAKNQDILVSGRWRTLGFAVPAAIAAQLEHPSRQVVAVTGDGGAVQTIMEFLTAVEHRLPIKVIVLANRSYAMEKNRMIARGLKTLGSRFRGPDFSAIARACGGAGWKAATAHEFRRFLKEALQLQEPALIEVGTAETMVPHTKI